MLCPHCGHDNTAGRKYCRSCTKPLAPETIPSQPAPIAIQPPAVPTPVPATAPAVSKMAIASLALSFLAFIVPLGIASVVMGHMSRSQIARSNGRQAGTRLAFAGLVISYFQFFVVALLCLGLAAAWHRMNQEMGHDEFGRAALAEYFLHDARASTTSNRQNAIDAMRLIHARQTEYLAAHPNEGYACGLSLLGSDPTGADELNLHMVNSHYENKLYQCRGTNDRRYAVVAIPQSDSNPPNSPVYCVDQTGIVRRMGADFINDMARVFISEGGSCPQSGEPVE